MAEQTITTQALADILARGERTKETRAQIGPFLEQIATLFTDEVGPVEADVGTRASSGKHTIKFIDRAYFYLAPEFRGTYFPMLTVYLFPGQLWWGLHAWGKEAEAQLISETLQDLDLVSDHELLEGTGAFQAYEAWGTGGYVSAGRHLSAGELSERHDVAELAQEIASDLAEWWQRLHPQLPTLRERLEFVEGTTAPHAESEQGLAEPFSLIFENREEANWALDLIRTTLEQVGIDNAEDDRFALTLANRYGGLNLHLNISFWLMLGFRRPELQERRVRLVLPADSVHDTVGLTLEQDYADVRDHKLVAYGVPLDRVRPFDEPLKLAYQDALEVFADRIKDAGRSRLRSNHLQEIAAAVFDQARRDPLFSTGLDWVAETDTEDFEDLGVEQILSPEPYSMESFASATYLLPQTITEMHDMVHDKRQLIFFGPPGTGKTFVAREMGKLITGLADPPPERMDIVQFHPAYGYEDFVEGIRPESKELDGRHIVDYPTKAGIFRRFCQNARRVDGPCVFIIDEINRGNIPRIFGELMLLLEYRDMEVSLPYSGKRFSIPKNVFIIGTMNTADRSIALVDFALRRRFHFFQFDADPDLFSRWLESNPLDIPYMANLYRRLSQEAIDDPNFAIGPSHFMKPALNESDLERIWRRSIMPYLREYYFDQPAKAKRWEWTSDFMSALRQSHDDE